MTRAVPPTVLRSARTVHKAVADDTALTVTAVLTYPEVDYAGDWVQPDGGTWDARPYVNVEHKSAVGHGAVTLKALDIDGKRWTLPVGTTHFRKGDRLAEQTYRLVADEIMTGVSLEFLPLESKSFGHPSPVEDRDAMDYRKWRGLGWAHTVKPINPGARTLLRDDPAMEKALKVAVDGRYQGEALDPVIRKAFAPLLEHRKTRTTVRVEKAMDDELDPTMAAPPVDAAPVDDPMAADAADDTPPTAKAAMDAAQGCSDLAGMIRDAVKRSEHLKGKNKLLKLADDLESCAEEAQAVGDMVLGDVGGGDDEPAESESDEAPEGDAPADDAPEESDEEKEAKAFTRLLRPIQKAADGLLVTKSGYEPRRFRFADLKEPEPTPAPVQKAEDPAEATRKRHLRRQVRELLQTVTALETAKAANGLM